MRPVVRRLLRTTRSGIFRRSLAMHSSPLDMMPVLLNNASMIRSSTSGLDLAVTHLNAPVGPVLTREQLMSAIRAGYLAAIQQPEAAALVTYLFVELEPSLIVRCVREAGSDLRHAHDLYEDTIRAKAPRSPNWERSVEHLL